jgi:hypothetical protein
LLCHRLCHSLLCASPHRLVKKPSGVFFSETDRAAPTHAQTSRHCRRVKLDSKSRRQVTLQSRPSSSSKLRFAPLIRMLVANLDDCQGTKCSIGDVRRKYCIGRWHVYDFTDVPERECGVDDESDKRQKVMNTRREGR